MASSSIPGQSEQAIVSSMTGSMPSAPAPLQAQTPSSEAVQPPSPNDISAAVILATLSESRPPTSQGEDEEELEGDNQEGGISLVEGAQGLYAPSSHSMAAPTYTTLTYDGEAMSLSAPYPWADMVEYASQATLNQHAAALESLSMEQLPSPSSTTPPGIPLSQALMAPAPYSTHGLENAVSPYEEHLSLQDKDSFLNISDFFYFYAAPPRATSLGLEAIQVPDVISRDDLQGDKYDFQAIDWSLRHTTRASIRAKRVAFESARMQPRVRQVRQTYPQTPDTENYFSFRRLNTRHRASFPHFQLRNVLAATSRNDLFYATPFKVVRTDASGSPATTVMDLRKRVTEGNPFQVTTLAATNAIVIAGGFEGEYAMTDLSSTFDTPYTFSRIKDRSPYSKSHITNHVHIYESRLTYTPQVVFCSNDNRLRVLDCGTNTFTHSFSYPSAVNCSATSPNGRMRVVVGDFQETLITNADTGQPFETLNSHTDDAFACAWADDGIHIATAAQDSTIVVWDARNWKRPLSVIHSELSIPRILRFSPVGSGPRVLIAAEADDYINIINAETFESKQVFDFFGSTAGISMTPDGQSLFIANSEPRFGGIIELERTGWGEDTSRKKWRTSLDEENLVMDWDDNDILNDDFRVPSGFQERSRRGVDLSNLVL